MVSLQDMKIQLNKCGIPCNIKDFSRKIRDEDELWDDIEKDYQQMEKWMNKRDKVMVSILSTRIMRAVEELMHLTVPR